MFSERQPLACYAYGSGAVLFEERFHGQKDRIAESVRLGVIYIATTWQPLWLAATSKFYFSLMLQAHLRSAGALLTSSAAQRPMEPPLSRTSLVSQQSEERGHEPYAPLNFGLRVRHITSTPIS